MSSAYAYIRGNMLFVENVIPGSKVLVYNFGGLILDQNTSIGSKVTFDYKSPCIVKITSDRTTQLIKVIR